MPAGLNNEIIYSIVVTYNGQEWIEKCLNSLTKSSVTSNIIVIDNGSIDQTVETIKTKFSNCQLIETKENLGFGKANNIGLSIALKNNADFVFLLNQDAWVERKTIEDLIVAQKKNPQFEILSPIHLNGDNTQLDYLFSIFIEPRKCPGLYSDMYFNKTSDKIYETEFVNAAAWLMTKGCLNIVGGFSPIFYHYGEDNNYCLRARYHNLKIGVYPLTKIYHDKDYTPTDYDKTESLRNRQKLVFYSDPIMNDQLENDIYVYKMSAVKSLFKLQITNYKKHLVTYRNLKGIQDTIGEYVNQSKLRTSSFLDRIN